MTAYAPFSPRRFGFLDIFIILLVVAGLCYSVTAIPNQEGSTVSVFRDGLLIARYPLSVSRDVSIDGDRGKLVLRIHDGAARVVSADCPGKLCISAGAIRLPSQEIICAPNHVLITIDSRSSGFDAYTR